MQKSKWYSKSSIHGPTSSFLLWHSMFPFMCFPHVYPLRVLIFLLPGRLYCLFWCQCHQIHVCREQVGYLLEMSHLQYIDDMYVYVCSDFKKHHWFCPAEHELSSVMTKTLFHNFQKRQSSWGIFNFICYWNYGKSRNHFPNGQNWLSQGLHNKKSHNRSLVWQIAKFHWICTAMPASVSSLASSALPICLVSEGTSLTINQLLLDSDACVCFGRLLIMNGFI